MNRLILFNWKEFGADTSSSIADAFEPEPYEGIEKIVQYLQNGTVTLVSPGFSIDQITGKRVMNTSCHMTDGEYSWSNMLAYYVKTYNMRLPREFELKVLSKKTIN